MKIWIQGNLTKIDFAIKIEGNEKFERLQIMVMHTFG